MIAGPLSSSSSGHNMQEQELISASGNVGGESAKNKSSISSATTSPIKDTIRGSQEMIKKLISSKDRLSGVVSSSSSEKVYSVTNTSTTSNKSNNTSSKNLIQNVKEKFGRRRSSKEHQSNATGDISGQSEQENQEKMVNLETS